MSARYAMRQGDSLALLRAMEAQSVHCVVTSPPYWALRDYGVRGQLGLESDPRLYLRKLVAIFREVRRVLRNDGTCWVNMGDNYSSGWPCQRRSVMGSGSLKNGKREARPPRLPFGLKNKEVIGMPWRLAFALQADGWYLRQDIIWCLSGGAWIYARTQKGEMPIMVRDIARLKAGSVQLWNGEKWTLLLGMSKSPRQGNELEMLLRSGERLSCTPTHKWPTHRGLLDASQLRVGDVLETCRLPEPETPRDCALDEDAAWLAGLYIAEGSMSEDTIQIAGHAREEGRWERLNKIAAKFGGKASRTIEGNNMTVRLYGKILVAIIAEFVTGRTSKDKGFAPVTWRYSNRFLASMLAGYLAGDGHLDGNRWRLGFCRNYNLERDLRTACARLGYKLTLKQSSVPYDGRLVPCFRGEIRMEAAEHFNCRPRSEIIAIRKARCREVYDLGVADEPHLFSLASGVLTHNSKPNPMPESCRDRCTKAHEYVFLLSKSPRYYFDQAAIAEPSSDKTNPRLAHNGKADVAGWAKGGGSHAAVDHASVKVPDSFKGSGPGRKFGPGQERLSTASRVKNNSSFDAAMAVMPPTRNKRSVWEVAPEAFREAHFATFPMALITPMILAGCPVDGTVLDPFAGTGTTGLAANANERHFIGLELNPEYIAMAHARRRSTLPFFDTQGA